jgi:hypothetical protein
MTKFVERGEEINCSTKKSWYSAKIDAATELRIMSVVE